MQKDVVKNVVLLTFVFFFFTAASTKAEIVSIPLVNPGAETGDMTGWSGYEFTAEGSTLFLGHHSGSYHFEASSGQGIDHMLNGHWMTMTQVVDLSAYAGRIEDIRVYAWAAADGLARYLGPGGGEDQVNALVGYDYYDSNGDRINGLIYAQETDGWTQVGGTSTWAANFNQYKNEIYSIKVQLGFALFCHQPNCPKHWEWEESPSYLSLDDASLELDVNPVPVPSSIFLFGSGLAAFICRRKKHKNSYV